MRLGQGVGYNFSANAKGGVERIVEYTDAQFFVLFSLFFSRALSPLVLCL